ncbi:MAG: very short patch repair endonuclease [Pseudomonadota bacterium]|nr:very short patch repair endonuclease [Pseudomonadota bacterium]
MTDHLSSGERSKNMAAIKGKNTTPEMVVRRLAHELGFRFRLHRRDLPGTPDLVFPKRKAVIFVHGCFWHQHQSMTCKARPPKTRTDYWLPKLQRNAERDKVNQEKLRRLGWRVLVIWECQTKDRERLTDQLIAFLTPLHN